MKFKKLKEKYELAQEYFEKALNFDNPDTGIGFLKGAMDITSKLDSIAEKEIPKLEENQYIELCEISHKTSRMFSEFREKLFEEYPHNNQVIQELTR